MIFGDKLSDHRRMDTSESERKWRYIRRIAELREARLMTQQEMADALGIPLERYKKYEQRSVLPPWYLDRFAAVVGRDIEFVLTGRPSRRARTPGRTIDKGADAGG